MSLGLEISSIIFFQAFSMNKFFPPDHFHKPFNNIAFIYHRNVVRHLASSSSLPLCYLSILPTCLISRHPSGHCLFKYCYIVFHRADILRETLQNASDAGAKQFAVQLFKDDKDIVLVVGNDGVFDED